MSRLCSIYLLVVWFDILLAVDMGAICPSDPCQLHHWLQCIVFAYSKVYCSHSGAAALYGAIYNAQG